MKVRIEYRLYPYGSPSESYKVTLLGDGWASSLHSRQALRIFCAAVGVTYLGSGFDQTFDLRGVALWTPVMALSAAARGVIRSGIELAPRPILAYAQWLDAGGPQMPVYLRGTRGHTALDEFVVLARSGQLPINTLAAVSRQIQNDGAVARHYAAQTMRTSP